MNFFLTSNSGQISHKKRIPIFIANLSLGGKTSSWTRSWGEKITYMARDLWGGRVQVYLQGREKALKAMELAMPGLSGDHK